MRPSDSRRSEHCFQFLKRADKLVWTCQKIRRSMSGPAKVAIVDLLQGLDREIHE
jgi:ribosomal protein L37AE/L43A